LRIVIQAILHRPRGGGVEKCIEATVRGLAGARLPFETTAIISDSLPLGDTPPGFSVKTVSYRSRVSRIMQEQWIAMRHRADLWHFLGYVLPAIPPRVPVVVSVYDIIALTHPCLCTRANRAYYAFALPRTLRRADRVIVPSHYVAGRIAERFPEAESRTRVVPLPLPPPIGSIGGGKSSGADVPRSDDGGQTNGYLLCLGDFGPKKNLPFLLRAYARLPKLLRQRHPLCICGAHGRSPRDLAALATRLGIDGDVIFQPYVEDRALPDLYSQAALLLYPSLEEGYGLPPLEAMALGTPAIVSDRGALPEVAGSAGATVASLDEDAFATAIQECLSSPKPERPAPPSILKKTWVDYAREIGRIYAELL
jgi:glycosyltransferase involved in cell wall biosynthesis